jgi:hypothetical protein
MDVCRAGGVSPHEKNPTGAAPIVGAIPEPYQKTLLLVEKGINPISCLWFFHALPPFCTYYSKKIRIDQKKDPEQNQGDEPLVDSTP